MILLDINTFWISILSGLIANTIFTILLVYLIQQLRYWYFLKRRFHNRSFNTYWKKFPNEIVQTVDCNVRGNRLYFRGKIETIEVDFEGQFIINPINLKTGEGFHIHQNSEGFAFIKIIIKDDNTFLVEAPFTVIKENHNGVKLSSRIYQAFIWRKVSKVNESKPFDAVKFMHEQREKLSEKLSRLTKRREF